MSSTKEGKAAVIVKRKCSVDEQQGKRNALAEGGLISSLLW